MWDPELFLKEIVLFFVIVGTLALLFGVMAGAVEFVKRIFRALK